MMELIRPGLKIDFLGKRAICFTLSTIAVALSLYLFISHGDAKYGTDFSGGHEFLVTFTGDVTSEKIRTALADQKIEDSKVQAFQGGEKEFSIRMGDIGGAGDVQAVRVRVDSALKAVFGEAFHIEKSDYVGPTVGKELRTSALMAVGLGLLGILIYIAFRFEFAVGLGTVVALFHDVVISTGIYLAVGHLISMATLAAALTIVGYSVNDTVVVFDRVREERNKRKNYDLGEIINEAINFTLSRTIITHMLTLFSALSLYLIGGGEIADLSLYLCAGIVCGSYSTIFIVAPVVVIWERARGRDGVAVPTAQAKRA